MKLWPRLHEIISSTNAKAAINSYDKLLSDDRVQVEMKIKIAIEKAVGHSATIMCSENATFHNALRCCCCFCSYEGSSNIWLTS